MASMGDDSYERFESKMNASDATMWRIERDPSLRTTILGVAVLNGSPDWDALRDRMVEAARVVPRLRQRVANTPFGIGTPRWVDDDDFDLDYHLRRVVAPSPGDMGTVLDLAAPVVMAAFDRDRPLWEFTLVEGLEGGRSALLQKIHHSVTDGVGAIRMARLLLDDQDGQRRNSSATKRRAARPASYSAGLSLPVDGAVRLVLGSLDATRHPVRTAQQLARTAGSVAKLVMPANEPLSPVMRGRGLSRRLATIELSLDDLREAGHAAGGTLNDAFLAAIAGGLRRYHDHHGAQAEAIRVTMPINLRNPDDPIGNNKFTPVRFVLPIDELDPIERMRAAGALAGSMRHEPGLKYTSGVAGVLASLPEQVTTMVMGGMLKAVDLVATNVPGLDAPASLCGVEVEQEIAFAPPSGAALSIALLSHVDLVTVGLTMDTAAVSDPATMASCLAEGFDEVIAAGRR
jgi:WS/DGAT/MGAT family acyltransferase